MRSWRTDRRYEHDGFEDCRGWLFVLLEQWFASRVSGVGGDDGGNNYEDNDIRQLFDNFTEQR